MRLGDDGPRAQPASPPRPAPRWRRAPESWRRPAAAARRAISGILQRGLHRITEASLTYGNAATLLVDATAVYPAMLERIRAAQRHVHFENYIFKDDEQGERFAEALAERARAGIEVRILFDWIGSFSSKRHFWDELRAAGAEVRAFGPPSLRHVTAILRRDHRKLLAVDGESAVVGGLCIGREWMKDAGTDCWRDTAVRLDGPIARELDLSFARMWLLAGGRDFAPLEPTEPASLAGVAARVVDGPPAHARAYRLYQLMAALAGNTLYVTGAYTLAPAPLRWALAAAARSSVDVRLLVPGRSDLPLLNQAARAHYAELLRAGVRIYEWTGSMLHAKTVVADGTLALVGSSNLNPFSLFGSYELDVEIQDAGFAGALERQFLTDLEHAREIRLAEWKCRLARQRWAERAGAALLWLPYALYSG